MRICRYTVQRFTVCSCLFAGVALGAACTERAPEPASEPAVAETEFSCDAPGVRQVVEQFGERLKDVPLLASDSVVVREIRAAYAPLVTADLLQTWVADPARAPGRQVSSPWPERIEVRSIESADAGRCRVEGELVYATSVEVEQGEAASRERVMLHVQKNDGWHIAAYEPAAPPEAVSTSSSSSSTQAADVIRRYYAAIDSQDFRRAYELWGDHGRASGQTFEAFAAGFAETAHAEVEIGTPGRVEPAAGSRYVAVPVVIRAVTERGDEQRFEGTYTLRRSVVDGATPEQRRWHIYSAEITRVR